MNDFITNKDKAIGRKLDIAKLMTEIHKYNGNINMIGNNGDMNMDSWEDMKRLLYEEEQKKNNENEEYYLNK